MGRVQEAPMNPASQRHAHSVNPHSHRPCAEHAAAAQVGGRMADTGSIDRGVVGVAVRTGNGQKVGGFVGGDADEIGRAVRMALGSSATDGSLVGRSKPMCCTCV